MTSEITARFVPPTPSAVLVELVRLLDDPGASPSQLATLVGGDTELAGHVLRAACSEFLGSGEPAGSALAAVAVLGEGRLRMAAFTWCLTGFLRTAASRGFDQAAFWRRSLNAAAAAFLLARRMSVFEPEEAFLAALAARIGEPAVFLHDSQTGAAADADPAEAAAAILADWRMPAHVIEAVRCQGGPAAAADPKAAILAQVLAVVGRAAEQMPLRADEPDLTTALSSSFRRLGIEPEHAENLLREVPDLAEQAAAMLALPAAWVHDVPTLLTDAERHVDQLCTEIDSVVSLREQARA